jgi:DNA-binding response OmpR family regulator
MNLWRSKMPDNLDNTKILEIIREINYYTLLDLFKFYKYNDKEKLKSIKVFFNFISKLTNKTFNNIFLIGERYEAVLEDFINNNENNSNIVFSKIIEGILILSESLDDIEYVMKNEDVDDNRVKKLVSKYENIMNVGIKNLGIETKKILIIDDDYEILQMLDLILPKYGYKTILTTNSKKVLNILDNNEIILCIVDYNMPRKNGLEVLNDIREKYEKLPVIFYTANNDKKVKEKALSMGDVKFISKPVPEKTIISAVKEILKNDNNNIDNNIKYLENENTSYKISKNSDEKEIDDKKSESKIKNIFKIYKSKDKIEEKSNVIKNNLENKKSNNKILFVDNEKLVVKLIKSKFEMENINVDFTITLKEAFKLSVVNEYALIILDFNIKDENIFEFIKNIKQNNITLNAKIIILSSDNSEKLKDELYNIGIDEFILKPFSVKELLIKVKKII